VLQPPADGWHDTGDIVTHRQGRLHHHPRRAKRFAKIGGEMVSLPAVEGYVNALWPGFDHAVVTRADPRKGEQLVLFTTCRDASASALQAGAAPMASPSWQSLGDIRTVDALPVLGTGKLDYVRDRGAGSARQPTRPSLRRDHPRHCLGRVFRSPPAPMSPARPDYPPEAGSGCTM